jgi:hypothetical protein
MLKGRSEERLGPRLMGGRLMRVLLAGTVSENFPALDSSTTLFLAERLLVRPPQPPKREQLAVVGFPMPITASASISPTRRSSG